MIPRFSSRLSNYAALSGYAAYRNARRFTREHPRKSLIAGAVLAAGALSAAGAAAGTTPWNEAFGSASASTHVASGVLSGQAGTSIFESVGGLKSPAAGQRPAADAARLDSRPGGVTRGAATVSPPAAGGKHAAAPAPAPKTKPLAAHAPAAKAFAARRAPAHPVAPHPAKPHAAPRRPAPKPKPYQIYDSVTPTAIPGGKSAAVYANGIYRASGSAVANHSNVLWIDVNGSNAAADVLDVEPGDATPAGAARWVRARLNSHRNSVAIVYTFRAAWPEVKRNVRALPSWMQSKVRYWIADPTGVDHILPGSSATQWYWGKSYDISSANLNFQVP